MKLYTENNGAVEKLSKGSVDTIFKVNSLHQYWSIKKKNINFNNIGYSDGNAEIILIDLDSLIKKDL